MAVSRKDLAYVLLERVSIVEATPVVKQQHCPRTNEWKMSPARELLHVLARKQQALDFPIMDG